MVSGEEEEDDSESFESLREQVEQVLDNAKNLLKQEVELEEALLDKGPGIISDLSGIVIRVMQADAIPVNYSTVDKYGGNTLGVKLFDGKVSLFFDGLMNLDGQKPKLPVELVRELMQDLPRLETFLQLLEDIVQHFVDAVKKIDQGRMSGINRIEAMMAKLENP